MHMLTIAALFIALWFAGLVLSFTLGGFIHLLLVVGVVIALTRILNTEETTFITSS